MCEQPLKAEGYHKQCLNINECESTEAAVLNFKCTCERCAWKDTKGGYRSAPPYHLSLLHSVIQSRGGMQDRGGAPVGTAADASVPTAAAGGLAGSYMSSVNVLHNEDGALHVHQVCFV